jgi:pyruvate ferredoxin oxidoreductase gamma subunit
MLGAVVKVAKLMDGDTFVEAMDKSFRHKFATKPQVIDGNMRALKRAMQEVKGL